MRKILYFMIALTVLSFASCKDTEGSIGDPIISHGQDRDTDIITGDDYVYHLPVIFHVFYNNTKFRNRVINRVLRHPIFFPAP